MSTLTQFLGSSSSTLAANQRPIELLIVGGGTGQGNSTLTTGGGAGQVVWYKQFVATTGQAYTITVGGGGSAGIGSNSSFGDLIAYGGSNGGSAASRTTGVNNPAFEPSIVTETFWRLANPGGGTALGNAGGGGAGGPGGEGLSTSGAPGDGGPGIHTYITGSRLAVGGGGGGGTSGTAIGYGGEGGGGTGGTASVAMNGSNGTANTGGGGGGGAPGGYTGGTGGSGVVIVAYPNTYAAPSGITGTYSTPTRSGYRVYRFTASGSITF